MRYNHYCVFGNEKYILTDNYNNLIIPDNG